MKKISKLLICTAAISLLSAGIALATPSTQIWIPSTDIQKFGTGHLGIDNYVATEGDTTTDSSAASVYVLGLTAGVLPFEKVQAEVGIDYISIGGAADDYPYYFNAKVATPEGALFAGSPALAVGGYNFGSETADTNQNIGYGLIAKTLPVVGRFSVGYFEANSDALTIGADNSGVLASWDRTLTEISPKLWAAVDYQGGDTALGALSFGLSWAFADNVSVIAGYDIYNNKAFYDTFTTQLDINF